MATLARTSTLEPIWEKVEAGERLDFEDGLALLETDDLLGSASSPTGRGGSAAAPTRSTSSRTST